MAAVATVAAALVAVVFGRPDAGFTGGVSAAWRVNHVNLN